ncbi:NYN domain-containing protein [bacterium (Candidatus Blackallbacteria) CG17_big_fil_post_rev_8_21_14_2_50_48_46]|uniref:NYN domain-containing protein n=1 Tax=bacterium (Candidatus Blackallbacteria) CG17_big_fil_post_rev_8_21_14_2_50_48_46 TaxID=2014261 RepID=A0A2M7FYV7_9BACT|nr:MAG: NYN domain-containing protein [bacterium (Candidatus Blackallbacteria) CG18_big_fil_WC_8_21_14_2_50_49_26]PIW14553.1 MAG: NYN domain-containing protein [bacterium (Candidatus Blackallbacteria) CG17_big_fil_post_rev_8_21_14_2_50_48_46]PIW47238.1 MAG: NYN domain-containing protein [bacterium (Candidatus Blackallbacteria) CG13_big_fil_rev_8_21_14_2_50_49_14]
MANLVYVDNSNVWIEGMHLASVKSGKAKNLSEAIQKNICDYSWKFDFGRLLHFTGGEKTEIKRAVLFGSRPPKNDSLWSAAEANGFEVVVYDRNFSNKEKKIDTDVVANMMEDSFTIVNKEEDEMILVSGDKDYVPAIIKIRSRNIKVVCCFWSQAASELKQCVDEFISLDEFHSYLAIT